MSFLATGFNIYFLLTIFIRRNSSFRQLVKDLGDFTTFPKPKNFDKVNKRMDILTHFLVIYAIVAVFVFGIFGIIDRADCLAENIELNLRRICGMLAPVLLPQSFNYNETMFWIGFINQLYTASAVCAAGILVMLILLGTTEILITRIQDFKKVLQKPFLELDATKRKHYLNYCVRYHCYIIDLGDKLNDNVSALAFVLASFTSGILAITSFQFLLKPEPKTFLHCLAWIMLLMMLSASGQRLIDESSEISETIYSTDWFVGNVEAQKYVQMIILRSNKNMFISSVFGQISFETFTAVKLKILISKNYF